MAKFSEILLTLFFVGKIKAAPGTFGSLASIIIFTILNYLLFQTTENFNLQASNIFWLTSLTLLTIIGSKLVKNYTENLNGETDHKSIVLDEFVGQVIASQITINLIYLNQNLSESQLYSAIALISSFILFRIFDITKPLIIGYCDNKIKNGFGVFLDDILAGLFAGGVICSLTIALHHFCPYLKFN